MEMKYLCLFCCELRNKRKRYAKIVFLNCTIKLLQKPLIASVRIEPRTFSLSSWQNSEVSEVILIANCVSKNRVAIGNVECLYSFSCAKRMERKKMCERQKQKSSQNSFRIQWPEHGNFSGFCVLYVCVRDRKLASQDKFIFSEDFTKVAHKLSILS